MSVIAEINSTDCGAHFRRADLHIHSFGEFGSYDVTDKNMTPENIVDLAVKEGLEVISITDHNVIGNVRRALNYAEGKPILLVPGVELSTPQGHLLIYCPDIESLEGFYGKLKISKDKKLCHELISECLYIANEYGGIGIASHIDQEAGFEMTVKGYSPFKEEIMKCQTLLGLEITSAENEHWYTDRDDNSNRKRIFIIRRDSISEDTSYEMAKVLFSDAHTLDALGYNASGNKKLTKLKMDTLSYDSMRIALIDATARVRIEDLIPSSIPRFIGIKFDGGFLNGQVVRFSKNLTCIIGGRGTGKSTMLEALRAASGNSARESLVDSEVWPDRITLIYEDEIGRQQVISRDKLGQAINADSDGLTFIPIESYGQGETAETIQHCDKDPNVLLTFLDEFADFGTLKKDDEELRRQLIENQQEIERLTIEVNSIPEVEKAFKNASAQLGTLKAQNAREIVELESSLSKERNFRGQLVTKLKELITSIKESFSDTSIKELVEDLDGSLLVAGKTEFENVKVLLENYSQSIEKVSNSISDETKKLISDINNQLKVWQEKEKETQTKIELIRKTLEDKGIKLDMAFIRKTTADVTHYSQTLRDLKKKRETLKELWKARRQLVRDRRIIKSRIYAIRSGLATNLNANLKATVVDYLVAIKFRDGLFSPTCQKLIQETMDWRTSQVPRAEHIARQISVFDLLELIRSENPQKLLDVTDYKGSRIFSKSEAMAILQKLNTIETKFALERCEFDDRPEITVTKLVELPDGSVKHISRDFSKLSLGQQQSILLSILLYSKSTQPLIIDQPEDNLDSEFIYRTLVRNLRRVKEYRQVIIVTHNANIAVLGDAELIVPLRSTSDRAAVINRGSIDNSATKNMACTILEGSNQAFIKRKKIYGI